MRPRRLAGLLLGCALTVTPLADASETEKRPNIILILADDLGYGDIGAYGQTRAETPHLDELARNGVRFTQHYSGASVCAPSRAALLTGRNTGHVQIRGNFELGDFTDEGERGQMPLAAGTSTLPSMLRAGGYSTALIGKWGLGAADSEGEPTRQGFDYAFGILDQKQAHNFYPTHLWENGKRFPLRNRFFIPHPQAGETTRAADAYGKFLGSDYAPDRLIVRAERYIEEQRPDRPFFLLYASALPHPALQLPRPMLARYEGRWPESPLDTTDYTPVMAPRAARAAMISRLDEEVGRLRAALARSGAADNTVIIFTSDNGPTREGGSDVEFFNAAGGLRGLKRDLYEGGIRVPLIVYWPGRTKPNSVSQTISANWDLLPTLGALAGTNAKEAVDGRSFLPAIEGRAQVQTAPLYWEFHERENPAQAARDGKWKAIRFLPHGFDEEAPVELYDLESDPGETRDVAARHPDVVVHMKAILRSRTRSPVPGFNFDARVRR